MTAPATVPDFLDLARQSGLLSQAQLDDLFGPSAPADPTRAAAALVQARLLTQYQAGQLLAGKSRGFFLGPYKILRPVGRGGMGAVFLAEQTSVGRNVAVKVLAAEKAKDPLALERFQREARAAAALDHPNIVRLFDFARAGGAHFLVMEFVDGTDLQSLMARTGPLHYAQAAQYIAQAAAGLQHAHEKGFVHRDIKPANLILAKDGTVKILDMGLARPRAGAGAELTAQLADGDIVGTVDFISPEQVMNHPTDARSDVYGLGATLYALVAGKAPFSGTTVQKLAQHQMREPPPLAEKLKGRVPPALSAVVARMMAKRPEDRYQSASEVIDALGPWQPTAAETVAQDAVATIDAPAPPALRSARPREDRGPKAPLWKRPPVLVGTGVGLLLIVGVALALTLGGKTDPPDRRTAGDPRSEPAPQPARPAPAGRPAAPFRGYRLDLSQQKEFTRTGGSAPTGEVAPDVRFAERERTGTGEFPAGFERSTPFGDGHEAEYAARKVDGVMAFGQRSLRLGQPYGASMMISPTLQFPGGKARVRIEYQADGGPGGGDNGCYLRFKATDPSIRTWDVPGGKLTGTDGQWKTVELEVPLQGATAGFFEIHSVNGDPNAWFWLKGFEAGEP